VRCQRSLQRRTRRHAQASSDRNDLLSIVLGELHFGARRSPNPVRNFERIGRVVAAVVLMPVDAATAALYGQPKADLMTAAQIIPDNGLWIAALARQHDLTLVSRDEHFGHVTGLKWVVW
jgi:tRNA(fMet)-specific endonuclease VapC